MFSASKLKREILRSINCSIKIYFELRLKEKALGRSLVCLTNKGLFLAALISSVFDRILYIWAAMNINFID